ncbi:MAG: class I SAM-dependent methyltransferase, partial [Sciscionella sp.]
LPIGSGRADAIIARGLLHHCADLARMLGEAPRCLRPDGVLLILDCAPMPAPDFEEMTRQLRAAGHFSEPRNGIDPNQLRELLHEVGFDEIASHRSGSWTNATPPFTERTFHSPAFVHRAVASRR